MKRKNPDLKVYLAVKSNFGSITNSRQNRLNFISSVLELFDVYKFDGLNLNVVDPGKSNINLTHHSITNESVNA